MKYLIIGLFLIPALCFGQSDSLLMGILPVDNGKVTYTKIIQIDSLSKDQLFLKVKEFAVNYYKSQKTTLETEDKEAGYLVYKGYFDWIHHYERGIFKGDPYSVNVYHTLKFYIKDNKIKIVFTDFEVASHDALNEYLSERNGRSVSKYPVELYYLKLVEARQKGVNKKKETQMEESVRDSYMRFNKEINSVLDFIISELQKKKSAFDF